MSAFDRLVAHAGPALSQSTPRLTDGCADLAGPLGKDVLALLWSRNGFLAFDAALYVLPSASESEAIGLAEWNADSLWRSAYKGLADGALFFALDLFGGQFGIANGEVFRFDPETGSREMMANSLEGWAHQILEDPGNETGWSLAVEWQNQFDAIDAAHRLIPKRPFVLGGEFTVDNLHPVESVKAMKFYSNLAIQIRDLPDGSQVSLQVVE